MTRHEKSKDIHTFFYLPVAPANETNTRLPVVFKSLVHTLILINSLILVCLQNLACRQMFWESYASEGFESYRPSPVKAGRLERALCQTTSRNWAMVKQMQIVIPWQLLSCCRWFRDKHRSPKIPRAILKREIKRPWLWMEFSWWTNFGKFVQRHFTTKLFWPFLTALDSFQFCTRLSFPIDFKLITLTNSICWKS